MGNNFNNGGSYISYINKHLEKKLVDLKTGFLRICLSRFIEVKRTMY